LLYLVYRQESIHNKLYKFAVSQYYSVTSRLTIVPLLRVVINLVYKHMMTSNVTN